MKVGRSFYIRKHLPKTANNHDVMTAKKKAIIFDLDNTIYPVHAIGDKLFADLFAIIEQSGAYQGEMAEIKDAIQRKPFQVVATKFRFGDTLIEEGLAILSQLEYDGVIEPFDDYQLTKRIDCLKFLVTTGFNRLQESKINQLRIRDDFDACYVVDPSACTHTKKDIFQKIAADHGLQPADILVIGDDIHSEIQAAKELGIDAVVYDHYDTLSAMDGYDIISHYGQLEPFLRGNSDGLHAKQ